MATGEKEKINVLAVIKTNQKHIILETRNLGIGYRKKKKENLLASQINLALPSQSLVGVIGINGIGKSTFLKTISGIQPPLAGNILIDSQDSALISPQQHAALVSLVLTQQPLASNLTVAELVALGRHPYTNWMGSLSNLDLQHIEQALGLVGIRSLAQHKCYELSDGQLQKVLIARAVAQDTPVMILDEPTVHLDLYHKAQVLKLLKNLSTKTGKTVIFATHEINLALQLCDLIILMKPGKIDRGSPQELLKQKVFDDLFPSDLIAFDESTQSFRIRT